MNYSLRFIFSLIKLQLKKSQFLVIYSRKMFCNSINIYVAKLFLLYFYAFSCLLHYNKIKLQFIFKYLTECERYFTFL